MVMRLRGVHLLIAVCTAATVWVFYNERGIVDPRSNLRELFNTDGWWLWAHATVGLTAFLVGPTQFSTRLRKRHLAIHRLLGRIYVGAVTIGAALGIQLAVVHLPFEIEAPALAQAGAWIITTGAAFLSIRRKNLIQHRQWMTRSYAVTFAFVSNRAVIFLLEVAGHSGRALVAAMIWAALLASLLFVEVGLSWRAILTTRPGRD
jgi:uncharacterized membrane protein